MTVPVDEGKCALPADAARPPLALVPGPAQGVLFGEGDGAEAVGAPVRHVARVEPDVQLEGVLPGEGVIERK